VQSFRNRLLQCEFPVGSQALPANLLQRVLLSFRRSTDSAKTLLQCGLPTDSFGHPLVLESFTGCRWISASPWSSLCCRGTACFTMVIATGCRGIFAQVPEAPPSPPFSLTLVSTELFFSHILTPLSSCCCCYAGVFSPLLNYVNTEALPLSLIGSVFPSSGSVLEPAGIAHRGSF